MGDILRKINFLGKLSFWLSVVQTMVYILGILLIYWLYTQILKSIEIGVWPPNNQDVNTWSEIVVAYAAIFAIGQYAVAYADIADRKTKTVLEFVKFFRESVLEKGSVINSYIKKNKINLPLILLRKNTPYFKFTPEEFFNRIAPNQSGLVQDYSKILADDLDFEALILSCLNSIEEFSIGILNSKSSDHKAVSSIKKPFIETVENFAVPLYFQIGDMADSFHYTSKLYGIWKKDVGYVPQTVDDKIERYEERKKKYLKN